MQKHIYYTCLVLIILLSSCKTGRNLVYFSDLRSGQETKETIENTIVPRIQVNDLLSITVSSLDPETNVLFNTGVLLPPNSPTSPVAAEKVSEGYLVNQEGDINFPVIGKVRLIGLTREEATRKMTDLISVHVRNPIVNIRFLNFRVTVIGEVNTPATFVVPTETVTILEALGLAGDMTVFGRRESVLLIREINGVRTTTRLNLNDASILKSPYYYLQQNDVVYVEPHNRSKLAQVDPFNRFIPIIISAISAISIYIATTAGR